MGRAKWVIWFVLSAFLMAKKFFNNNTEIMPKDQQSDKSWWVGMSRKQFTKVVERRTPDNIVEGKISGTEKADRRRQT